MQGYFNDNLEQCVGLIIYSVKGITVSGAMAEEQARLAEELRLAQQRLHDENLARQQEEAEAAQRHQAEVDALRAIADQARADAQAREAMLAMQGRALTDEQFAVFIGNLNDQYTRERTQDANRREQGRVTQILREEIKSQTKRIRPCDGSNPAAVREYLTEIGLASPYVAGNQQALNKILAATSQGALKRSYERFMTAQADREAVPWEAVRNHLRAAFLSQDETEHLRTALEKVRQTEYERNTAYTRRFQEAADDAYPLEDRTAGDVRVLLNAYVKGLRDSKVVERLVQETRPNTLQEAVTGVELFTASVQLRKDGPIGHSARCPGHRRPDRAGPLQPLLVGLDHR